MEWSAVEGANNYRLLRAPIERGIDGEYDVIYESFGLSFTDSNLPLGGAYYYRVRACDASNCGHSSEAVTLRLQRPGRARILFDQSGSSREVKSIGAALAPLSSVTVAWEETPDAQYYYVLRGGELAHHSAATISQPAITVTTTAGTISHTVTLTTPTSTTTLTLTNITEDGTITLGGPIPVLATTYLEGLHGDNVRHYWVRACNAFGCGEASEAVVLGGGLLGIGEKDNPRAAGVSVALTLVDASATGNDVVALTLTELVKAPTGVSASACRADVVTEVVDGKIVGNGGGPRVNFDWDARSGGEAEGRFYRFARSRFADGTSADWIDITAPAAVSRSDNSPLIANGIRTNFAATTFIDHSPFNENDIRNNFVATTLHYGVQECAAVRLGTDDASFDVALTLTNGNVTVTTVYPHESPICSAPVFVEVAPQSSLPQCAGDGVASAPGKVEILPDLSGSEIIPIYEVNEQEFVAVDEDGNKITATYAGPEYILAVAAFSVKWDSIPGAAYYRVTRESGNSDGGESSFAAYFVDQGTTEFIERTPFSPGLVNVYWVQACDRQNGCGTLSDPLELAAPPEELDASAVRSPVVVVAPVDSGFVAAIFVVGSPFADRYVLSRAPKPASGEATIYVDLQEEDAPFVRLDEDLESGAEYLYRALVCNADICVISEPTLIAVGPAGPIAPPGDRIASQAAFVDAIEEGDFDWFSAATDMIVIVDGGSPSDWDNDEIANPYDWTPLPGVILTTGNEDGSADNPWPIYNVWQLQAIDGMSVSDGGTLSGDFAFFGDSASAGLTAQYVLSVDIDATPTKEWKNNAGATVGFNPIGGGDSFDSDDEFTGVFDGNDNVVRGLFIDRTSNDNVGLFAEIDKDSELAVSNLGVEEADIRGKAGVGIIAGNLDEAEVSRVWTTGKVVGSGNEVGGLVGGTNNNDGSEKGFIKMSWSTADVKGANSVGGITGGNDTSGGVKTNFEDNWAAGNVIGNDGVGGFFGDVFHADYARNWSSGEVSGATNVGGFVGSRLIASSDDSIYWNLDTSGQTESAAGVSVFVQTLVASNFADSDGDETAANAAWDFGDIDLSESDGVADFPLLKSHSQPLQAVNLARALTRILGVGDAATIVAAAGTTITTDALRLDTNGRAPDTRNGGTSTPSCSFDGGALRAQTNYNSVTVELSLLTDGTQNLVEITAENTANCEVGFTNAASEFGATLRLEISAPAASADDPARTLTMDYVLRIAPPPPPVNPDPTPVEPIASRAAFVEAIEKSDFNWFSAATDMIVIVDGGSPSDWDNDEIANPYDWTPLPGVILTTGDENGSADNPWPIYNVWQLQAIDGLSVSENGVVGSENFAFFGDGDNLTAHYRLAADIDATPTRNWAGGGFRPIGNLTNINIPTGDFFQGALNGDGYEIRGLSVNFANDHVGLFSGIGGTGSVVSLQLLDLFVSGGSGSTGGLVGFSSGLVSLVGGSGVVEGGSGIRVRVGGLAGWLRNDADIAESWFAGEVKGNPSTNIVGVGGLVGSAAQSQTPTRVNNNWAQSRVTDVNRDSATHVGGLIGVMGSSFQNGWSGGEVFGSSPLGLIGGNLGFPSGGGGYSDRSTSGAENAVSGSAISAQSVETMVTVTQADSGWPNNVWNFGGATDYPFLARYEAMRPGAQAAFYALHQTRLRFGEVEATRGEELELVSGDVFRLDTNGRADDDPTPAPSCVLLGSGEVRAQTNYNGVTVLLRSDGAATFSLPDACNVEILFGDEVDAFTLTVVAMAGEATVAAAYSFAGGVFSPLLPTELLSPPAAAAGEAIYTVAIGAGAQLREFTNVSGLSSESGSPEVLKLAMDATVLFATDNAAFNLTLTAMLSGGAVETRVVEVKSDIRLISGEKVELTSNIRLGQEHILLLPESVGLSIWHNGDEPEQYGLIQSGSQDLFTVSATSGTVRVRKEGSLPTRLSEGTYNITIYRSASSPRPLTVMRELQLVVDESAPESNLPIIGPPPSPLMIEAPDEPVVVAADASAGVTILTVSTSGGTNPVFVAAANDNLEASGGGDTALVSLTEMRRLRLLRTT